MCGESPQEVPLCGTGRHGFAVQNVPHIFFLSCQKLSFIKLSLNAVDTNKTFILCCIAISVANAIQLEVVPNLLICSIPKSYNCHIFPPLIFHCSLYFAWIFIFANILYYVCKCLFVSNA